MENLTHIISAIAGTIIIGGLLRTILRLVMGPGGITQSRRVFQFTGSLPVTLPRSPSVEFLPFKPNQDDGLTQASVFDITPWEDIPLGSWHKREMIAVLQIFEGPRIAVVNHKEHKGTNFENSTSLEDYDLVLGLDVGSWRRARAVPGPNNPDRISATLRGCHWVKAGLPKHLEWRRYRATYRVVDPNKPTVTHPRTEEGWALCRDGIPLDKTYYLPPTNTSSQRFPYYTILESEEGKFQAVRRTIYGPGEISGRRGERTIHWEGSERTSFVDAVKDIFQELELNCPPVYRRNLESTPECPYPP